MGVSSLSSAHLFVRGFDGIPQRAQHFRTAAPDAATDVVEVRLADAKGSRGFALGPVFLHAFVQFFEQLIVGNRIGHPENID